MIASHNRLGSARECAFQNAIVRLVLDHSQPSPRTDCQSELGQEHGDVRDFLGIAREFASEDAEQFLQDGLGDNELVLLLDDAP